jgi:hypothetical protein
LGSSNMVSLCSKLSTRCAAVLAMLLMISATASSTTLREYSNQIEKARTSTDELISVVSRSDRNPNLEKEKALAIVEMIPATQKVEWPGGAINTDNKWLVEALGEFSIELATPKGKQILLGISERLQAIGNAVNTLEASTLVKSSKDEDKQKLAEILSRDEYQKPTEQGESLFQKWIAKFLEWLAKFLPGPSESAPSISGTGSLQLVIQVLICLAVIGLVGFLLYKFVPLISKRFRDPSKEKKKDRVILGERVAAEESATDLFAEAESLARVGDLRGAIRKGYIAVLCELSDRKVIGLARHKTNRDYLRDVYKRSDIFENVAALTGSYERNWYGLRDAGQPDWEDFRARYRQTITKV